MPPLPLDIYVEVLKYLTRAEMLHLLLTHRELWKTAQRDLYRSIVGPLNFRQSIRLLCSLVRFPVMADHVRVFDAYLIKPRAFHLLYTALHMCTRLEILSLPEGAEDCRLTSYHPHLRALRTGGPAPLNFVARHSGLTTLHLCDDELDCDPSVLGFGNDLEYLCVNHVLACNWLEMCPSNGRLLTPTTILNVFLHYPSRYRPHSYTRLLDAIAAAVTCPQTLVVDATVVDDLGSAAAIQHPHPYPHPNEVRHLYVEADNLHSMVPRLGCHSICDVLRGFPNVETLQLFNHTASCCWLQRMCPNFMKGTAVPKLQSVIWPDGEASRLSAHGEWQAMEEDSHGPSAIDVFDMEGFSQCFDGSA